MKSIKLIGTGMILLLSIIFFQGCKSESNPLDSQIEAEATEDAAVTVATAVASSAGGSLDQVEDILNIATTTGIENQSGVTLSPFGASSANVTRVYDSVTGVWTITVLRERGNIAGRYYATFSRVYNVQFLNQNNQFQRNFVTNRDTAYSINFKLVSGSSTIKTPRLSHRLLSVTGEWIATNTNTRNVTINTKPNGTFTRAASDTVSGENFMRTLNNNLSLNFINVVGPRGSGLNWQSKTSGQLIGTYTATVTFLRGTQYREKIINREINITLGGGNRATMNIGGAKFDLDLLTGEFVKL